MKRQNKLGTITCLLTKIHPNSHKQTILLSAKRQRDFRVSCILTQPKQTHSYDDLHIQNVIEEGTDTAVNLVR